MADATPGAFPAGGFLLVVGVAGSCNVPQGSCNVDLAFPELFLDGSHVASGIQINNVMGTTVGPAFYALNFSSFGIQINAGHEVMVDRAWLGESNFDYEWTHADPPKAVAVQVNGNDHYVLNTVVFSSKIGLEVNGAANRVDGVHVWFPYNQALVSAAAALPHTRIRTPAAASGQHWGGPTPRAAATPPPPPSSLPPLAGLREGGRHGVSHHCWPEPLHWLLH